MKSSNSSKSEITSFDQKLLGKTLKNRYKVESFLCAGAFGRVFLVMDRHEKINDNKK